jgi:hypothetical protein
MRGRLRRGIPARDSGEAARRPAAPVTLAAMSVGAAVILCAVLLIIAIGLSSAAFTGSRRHHAGLLRRDGAD